MTAKALQIDIKYVPIGNRQGLLEPNVVKYSVLNVFNPSILWEMMSVEVMTIMKVVHSPPTFQLVPNRQLRISCRIRHWIRSGIAQVVWAHVSAMPVLSKERGTKREK